MGANEGVRIEVEKKEEGNEEDEKVGVVELSSLSEEDYRFQRR